MVLWRLDVRTRLEMRVWDSATDRPPGKEVARATLRAPLPAVRRKAPKTYGVPETTQREGVQGCGQVGETEDREMSTDPAALGSLVLLTKHTLVEWEPVVRLEWVLKRKAEKE